MTDGLIDRLTTVTFDVTDHIATITLDRPAVMNAFNQPMLDEFRALWHECRTNDDIHVVVLQANGERAFSTGVDRVEGRHRPSNPWSEDDPGQFLGAKQNRVWKPLICAVHGMAAGGAFYWLNEADVIICSDDASFFDPHTTYGMTSAIEPVGLLGRIPFADVMRLALFGLDERISAATALQIRLVSEVVPVADLRSRAHALAERLASKPPLAVQGTVKAIWDARHMSAHGQREIPLVYPQLANPMSKVEMDAVERPPFELR
jgi:enoyl-CoA hydratase/carnithine racemase